MSETPAVKTASPSQKSPTSKSNINNNDNGPTENVALDSQEPTLLQDASAGNVPSSGDTTQSPIDNDTYNEAVATAQVAMPNLTGKLIFRIHLN